MKQEEILKSNKLIAEFMGVKIGVDNYSYRVGCVEPLKETHLNYHKEWGWLMPVVEKLEKMGYGMNITPHDVKVVDYTTGNEEGRYFFINDGNYSKIYQIYCTVVGFIKWYNTQNN